MFLYVQNIQKQQNQSENLFDRAIEARFSNSLIFRLCFTDIELGFNRIIPNPWTNFTIAFWFKIKDVHALTQDGWFCLLLIKAFF
jgi:hypothetical protein